MKIGRFVLPKAAYHADWGSKVAETLGKAQIAITRADDITYPDLVECMGICKFFDDLDLTQEGEVEIPLYHIRAYDDPDKTFAEIRREDEEDWRVCTEEKKVQIAIVESGRIH